MKSQTVFDIIANSPNHTTLASAVIAAGLDGALSGPGPFTVFAPTDAAFEALPPTVISDLLSDPQGELTTILLYHVLDSQVLSNELVDGMMVTTLQGEEITVTINGSDVFINDAQVTFPDIQGTNGVVHVIDAVLLPPVMPTNTIMDIVTNSADHNTLEIALNASGLNETLGNPGDFTLFAPTDAAFDLLPAGTVETLLADPTGALANVLLYHALSGTVLSSMLSDGMMATTIQGSDITVTINGSDVFINDAQVIFADIMATNGVVHVIDAVLIPEETQTPATVVDIIVNSPDHTTLETAVIAAGLADDLSGTGPFTVFAPTDAAFSALPATLIAQLLADPTGQLAQILLYHVVAAEAPSSSLSNGQIITTLQGEDVTVTINADGVFINNAQVTTADIMADNGVVHVIDAVLLPPPPPTNTILDIVVNSAEHNTLEAAVVAAGLQGALSGPGPLTVFAPTDAAFAALPAGVVDALLADPTGALTNVLLYHAVSSVAMSSDLSNGMMITTLQGQDVTVTINADGVFINNARVTTADIMADNGVVHVIDAVLVPEETPATVVDIIVNSPDHTTLETAVIAAGLADDLSGTGPFTVFAPTDAAFAALPATLIAQLLADPTGQLAQILLYHVVAGEAPSSSLSNGQTVTTLQGDDVTVSITNGNVFINDAQVTVADIMADNGIVHVINAVLTPSSSVNESNMQSALVYPNPASEMLNVNMTGVMGSTQFEIYSVTGKLMSTGSLNGMTNSISLEALSQGMYQLKLTNGAECVSHSFMKN